MNGGHTLVAYRAFRGDDKGGIFGKELYVLVMGFRVVGDFVVIGEEIFDCLVGVVFRKLRGCFVETHGCLERPLQCDGVRN